MIPDAEIISLMCTILTRLEVGEFTVKVRSRSSSHPIFDSLTCVIFFLIS